MSSTPQPIAPMFSSSTRPSGICGADALRYWERRRILYNLLLTAVVIVWIVATCPMSAPPLHGRTLLRFSSSPCLRIFVCAAYVADLPMQYSSFRQLWRHRRGALFATGTLFAIILANYWIVDEIYSYVPYVR
jgi:hypothetical protein